ncbi:hypothetical protein A3D00_00210 [Candidatus Woesebacteria bacterium RIFCSPHIGHO2_02_FULL_38_9]|uniref:UDP-N-acetylglucosamine 1-carboxyvinyltransferase n=1 Tax=Candidatus Woesebacteria bacterium RIFCSPHIGHO2_01_FULL_39_28 TaxID=1802496 RepID=A0A1F7YDE1_9BACT|nr:MAG: hypothetical protein A2627_02990 [Candidatus Woesebacteria bacterium RIFCSPHIGHO2_01_FULL_39_28]OGM35283.1 MAG: hypothetical protein A3D00_00210 [Candidatus Woesebacteria bacterium RIFCSPHIGHO2_02_FULL_38_9]OGM58013.1 MAG: hypothetical protein A3A50_02000 [Candidatus Woesebacteria bacterium RIFCSPLOWO2_01_FULL_38_20]
MNIKVKGGQVLEGEITPSGSKNSAVAIIPSTLLFDKPVFLENIPDITDVDKLITILRMFGSKIDWNKSKCTMKIDNAKVALENISKEDLGTMRGSSLLWGPMLARFGKIEFGKRPAGCNLGYRTLSPHYQAFEDLGSEVSESDTGISMNRKKAEGGDIWLTEMSPTATENVLMLATALKRATRIYNAASEPQVQDLCNFLVSSGASISGIGSNTLLVEGSKYLKSGGYKLLPDHYEIATFLALGAATGGRVKVNNAMPSFFTPIIRVFSKFGIEIYYKDEAAIVEAGQKIKIISDEARKILTIKAHPWPGLPVDILPLFIPISLLARSGQVLFHNWMYEAGLFWTNELGKLGANIVMCDPHRVITISGNGLRGAIMDAPYIIRAVVAMTMAAMISKGESIIRNADSVNRGHPHFVKNLQKLGASIEEIRE